MPDNQGYVTWVNNEIKLERFDMPSFHHKQSVEDFKLDTGIEWTVNLEKKIEETKTLTKSEQKKEGQKKKKIKEEIMRKIMFWRETEKKSWDTIKEELALQEKDGIIPDMGFEQKSPVYFSNWYGAWKKKMA